LGDSAGCYGGVFGDVGDGSDESVLLVEVKGKEGVENWMS